MHDRDASDEALLRAHASGDPAAFEALFRRHHPALVRHLERMLRERAAAEDLAAESFVRLHRHAGRLRAGSMVRPWLCTIARNLASNRLRRERLRGWLPLGTLDGAAGVSSPSPVASAEHRIIRAFATLPVRQREVCSLRLVAGLELGEIADVTGVSLGTVKSRLFYGQRRLRALLADLDPADG